MPADDGSGSGGRRVRRRVALVAVVVLLALTALAWWVSGRWLERPAPPPPAPRQAG